jgi:hypothetical protein
MGGFHPLGVRHPAISDAQTRRRAS